MRRIIVAFAISLMLAADAVPAQAQVAATPTIPALTAPIPSTAEIVYFFAGHIYVIDARGGNITQLTFGSPPVRFWEHVAVSYDHRYAVGNEHRSPIEPLPGGMSSLWLFDLKLGTQRQLVPDFQSAGNGGVTWGPDGFIYFAGRPAARGTFSFEDIFGAGANDVYRVKPDGTGLKRLVRTPDRGEADVGISADGRTIAFVAQPLGEDYTELWTARSDGSRLRLAYRAGKIGVASAHDPEPSDDGRRLAFSIPNPKVAPNFCEYPWACTAHDIHILDLTTRKMWRATRPGPISIAPNWRYDSLVYTELNEKRNYLGAAIVRDDRRDQEPLRIHHDASAPKWIP